MMALPPLFFFSNVLLLLRCGRSIERIDAIICVGLFQLSSHTIFSKKKKKCQL
jgi:hypothetical protein